MLVLLGGTTVLGSTLSLPADAGAPPGSSTAVPLSTDDANGWLGTDILITYDPAVASATGVSKTALTAGQTLTFNLSPPGSIRISLFGTSPLGGSGAFVTLSFSSVGPLESRTALDLRSAIINEGAIPAVLVDGRYCVQGLPAEVRNFLVGPAGADPNVMALQWDADPFAAVYNIYRGRRPDLGDLACFLAGVAGTSVLDDGAVPDPEGVIVYLVTAENCRAEAGLGSASSNEPRANSSPCP
ncbi:MAG: cohesin domain-containing protein [Dehalococcoidia bacterium]|nr:cohesin domain-containing protein [Dehalococcoidia bacterium]